MKYMFIVIWLNDVKSLCHNSCSKCQFVCFASHAHVNHRLHCQWCSGSRRAKRATSAASV